MRDRNTRFKIALALAGHGSLDRLAGEYGVLPANMQHIAAGRPARKGGPPRRNWRIETAIESFIVEQFKLHASILSLEQDAQEVNP